MYSSKIKDQIKKRKRKHAQKSHCSFGGAQSEAPRLQLCWQAETAGAERSTCVQDVEAGPQSKSSLTAGAERSTCVQDVQRQVPRAKGVSTGKTE